MVRNRGAEPKTTTGGRVKHVGATSGNRRLRFESAAPGFMSCVPGRSRRLPGSASRSSAPPTVGMALRSTAILRMTSSAKLGRRTSWRSCGSCAGSPASRRHSLKFPWRIANFSSGAIGIMMAGAALSASRRGARAVIPSGLGSQCIGVGFERRASLVSRRSAVASIRRIKIGARDGSSALRLRVRMDRMKRGS